MGKRLVHGVGVNDAGYTVKPTIDGRRVNCPYYECWVGMLKRCYSSKCHNSHPTYIGCSVCDEWLTFSNFKAWMEKQDWRGKELDKDILLPGNKIYFPDGCVFVRAGINCFVIDSMATRGAYKIGVSWNKINKNFRAYCQNPFTRKMECLGSHNTELAAHMAWKRRKHELACQLADLEDNNRLSSALRLRYA